MMTRVARAGSSPANDASPLDHRTVVWLATRQLELRFGTAGPAARETLHKLKTGTLVSAMVNGALVQLEWPSLDEAVNSMARDEERLARYEELQGNAPCFDPREYPDDTHWTVDDQERAIAEGWAFFELDGEHRLQIVAITENDVEGAIDFSGDDAALAHVGRKAAQDSSPTGGIYRRALEIHERHQQQLGYGAR